MKKHLLAALAIGLLASGHALADTVSDTTYIEVDVSAMCYFNATEVVERTLAAGSFTTTAGFSLLVNCNDQLPYFINANNTENGTLWLDSGTDSMPAEVRLTHPIAGTHLVGELPTNAYTDYGTGTWQNIPGTITFNPQTAANIFNGRLPRAGTYTRTLYWDLTL
ncbi:hypothetical protein [Pseudoxanthomonas winnipegensis]|uniref:hypothetical protein n=1 Tax=Pseudoxanthomonas winnipegensis TaxID=2480810 RepID=UPI00103FB441|nr:hypothetical protein [Pseudoxanthomonas winnipegensis]TBV69174.1 hypothetical protein EYC45_19845 [Pseudoxanthomonas winnipegensis]